MHLKMSQGEFDAWLMPSSNCRGYIAAIASLICRSGSGRWWRKMGGHCTCCSHCASAHLQFCVLLNRVWPPAQQCVVLLHELAHYILHFPLLLQAQWADDLSDWAPELELFWAAYCTRYIPGGIATLEHQANLLASCFLMPLTPSARKAWHNEHLISDGRDMRKSPELMAEALLPYFEELREKVRGQHLQQWRKLRKWSKKASKNVADLNHAAPASLPLAIFAALREREAGEIVDINDMTNLVMKAHAAFQQLLSDVSTQVVPETTPSERFHAQQAALLRCVDESIVNDAAAWAPSLENRMRCKAPPEESASELGALYPDADRVLIPPKGWNERHMLFPRQSLQPTMWNLEGALQGEWVPLGQLYGPVGTLDEFLAHAPPGQGLSLHRYTTWQQDLIDWEGNTPVLEPALLQALTDEGAFNGMSAKEKDLALRQLVTMIQDSPPEERSVQDDEDPQFGNLERHLSGSIGGESPEKLGAHHGG